MRTVLIYIVRNHHCHHCYHLHAIAYLESLAKADDTQSVFVCKEMKSYTLPSKNKTLLRNTKEEPAVTV